MEIALIGLSGSGKTTLFNTLTGGSHRPGSAGDARDRVQVGVARVPDPRLDVLAEIFKPQKVTPAEITYWDTPLTKDGGGSKTAIEGQVLNQLQGADALVHVVRAFEDPTVPHLQGSVDPLRDVATIASELTLSDMVILERRSQRVIDSMKGALGHEKDLLLREQTLLQRVREALLEGEPVVRQSFSAEEANSLANYQLLTAKPLLVVHNIGEESLSRGAETETLLSQTLDRHGLKGVALCVKLEWELAQLSPEEEQEFRESMGVGESGVGTLIRESLALLRMVTFFTFVSQEARAWTVPQETAAAQAAGKIHSDIERGFIRAEVVHFDDMVSCGSIVDARKGGLLRAEGKTYLVQDGDVITFLFNV